MRAHYSTNIYADYGTFALASTGTELNFPEDVSDTDMRNGHRHHEKNLILYLPDLNDYSLTVEVFLGSWDESSEQADLEFATIFTSDGGSFAACGLMEELSEKPDFSIPKGTYHCSCRAYFRGTKNRYQIKLEPKTN